MTTQFKLLGLNKPWKAAGFNSIYATVDKGNEDWFHCAFSKAHFPDDKLNSLFSLFKDSEENLWHKRNHKVKVNYDQGQPLIVELILDNISIAPTMTKTKEQSAIEVLKELVELKDMKDGWDILEWDDPAKYHLEREDYLTRKPLAWEAARKLISGEGLEEDQVNDYIRIVRGKGLKIGDSCFIENQEGDYSANYILKSVSDNGRAEFEKEGWGALGCDISQAFKIIYHNP